MKCALECFQHAAKCEEQARQAISDAGRVVLLETAVEAPVLSMQRQKQVPPLRLATLGSGRDDEA
jgi:hypothetical protein